MEMEGNLPSPSAETPRKRPRENETDSQKLKREKAAVRQRRKRERDRNSSTASAAAAASAVAATAAASIPGLMGFSPNDHHSHHLLQHQHPQQSPHALSAPVPSTTSNYQIHPDGLSPEEVIRRDRIRAAARERQRKHRIVVKQRKLRTLGLDMGNEMPVDESQYRYGSSGHYPQIISHDLQGHPPGPLQHMQDPPFPQTGPNTTPPGGQTFASTLLLSFSCAPLLKQHLLRSLHMTNEELASLEPILAEAWERWDHARRAHYAEQAAKAGIPYPPVVPVDSSLSAEAQVQLEVAAAAAAGGESASTPSSASASSMTSGEVIDPQLTAVSSSATGVKVKSEAVAPVNGASMPVVPVKKE